MKHAASARGRQKYTSVSDPTHLGPIQRIVSVALASLSLGNAAVAQLPAGYWDADRSQPLLDRTLEVTLAPDLTALPANERDAVQRLLEAGEIV